MTSNVEEKLSKRRLLLNSFMRMNIPLERRVYEFCDMFITDGLEYTSDSNLKIEFESYVNQRYWNSYSNNSGTSS
tara:strand:+ start:479 stop:703 length:225 start_codon:yes stop_codon:yes gene_type:complete